MADPHHHPSPGGTPMRRIAALAVLLVSSACFFAQPPAQDAAGPETPWPAGKANRWLERQGWLAGCNYLPATAINQLEMWQADTFDSDTIDRELGYAEHLGFNSLRVFLHHLLWEQDAKGFLQRMDRFLDLAAKHKIGVMFVLFDSCWDPHPRLGKPPAP